MNDNLQKVQLNKKKDPKVLIAETSVPDVKFGIPLASDKKAPVVLQAGQDDYATVMTVTHTIIFSAYMRSTTAEELVDEIHK